MADNPAFNETNYTTSFTSSDPTPTASEPNNNDDNAYETVDIEVEQSNPTTSSITSEIPAPYAGE